MPNSVNSGGNGEHSNQLERLANQRLACVVAGLVKMTDFEFDSHALPPLTGNGYETTMDPIRVLQIASFDRPDEVHTFPKGRLEIVRIGGMLLGRASYEPGWRWSEHVGAKTGARLCEVEHLCFVLSGKSGLRMRDGTERILSPGDLFAVPPGHDSWVVGDEPYVSLHLLGAADYGAQHR